MSDYGILATKNRQIIRDQDDKRLLVVRDVQRYATECRCKCCNNEEIPMDFHNGKPVWDYNYECSACGYDGTNDGQSSWCSFNLTPKWTAEIMPVPYSWLVCKLYGFYIDCIRNPYRRSKTSYVGWRWR